jgi:glutaredoxin
MPEVIVYSQTRNLHCEVLKGALREQGVQYREIDIRDPEAIVELKQHGCHALEPPVIGVRAGSRIQALLTNDDLFWDGTLVREAVLDLAGGSR